MLVLFETSGGFALFKVLDEGKLSNVEVIYLIHSLILSLILTLSMCSFFFLYIKYVKFVLVGFGY